MLLPMRTYLYVPGNKAAMIRKAPRYGADVLVLDLEDSVPPNEKSSARSILAEILAAGDLGAATVMVRINRFGTGESALDLPSVVVEGVTGLRIPKVESAEEIHGLDEAVTALERQTGMVAGALRFVPILESPLGVLRAFEIATASQRVLALSLGGEDLTAALGTERTRDALELQHARGHIVLCAAAANVAAIDTIYPDVQDEDGLRDETRRIKQMGFSGKSVIHPRQIAPIHEIFAPSRLEVERARRIVEAFQRAQAEGSGAVAVDGRMVDLPVVARAAHTLALAGEGSFGGKYE